ncbi:hypothetical protein HY468_05195 [Candidatus Roizmanbacteria bacterium]|nr:hypothetical protein [Candidatus Roizmanbacteria bacterium]
MKSRYKTVLIGCLISIISIGFGYFLGRYHQQRLPQATIPPAISPTQQTVTPPVTPIEDVQGACDNGFKRFENKDFSICYPEELARLTQATISAQLFATDEEELTIAESSDKKWGLHICNLSQGTSVAGFPARRTIFKEQLGSGCGRPVGYATQIDLGKPHPFLIEYRKKRGVFTEASGFEAIERSLIILMHVTPREGGSQDEYVWE